MSTPRHVIVSQTAPAPVAAYSQAIASGDLLFCSGQIALDPGTGQIVQGGIEAETERVLENLKAVLAAAGASLSDVVKTTVYLADFSEFQAMNEIYVRAFPQDPPARTTAFVSALPRGAKIELEAIARLP
ncbi:MAG TPA: Rid family detoxifying hydrolase [Polyangiaceae bacterium]|nr:Rid family detoxifying hydrolase [Polyangiaceae bacterium]